MESQSEYFDKILEASEKSEVYRQFCKDLYGTKLIQYNMMMKSQLDKLEEICELSTESSFLDLGCGIGGITEYLSRKYSCTGLGIDFAPRAISLASERTRGQKNLKFEVGNIAQLRPFEEKFDTILSIDTLYFVPDIKGAIQNWSKLCKPGGQLIAFFTQSKKVEGDSTDLAKAFSALGMEYQFWNYSDDEKNLWIRARKLMEQIKPQLSSEGYSAVYQGWKDAIDRTCPFCEDGQIVRYLYSAPQESHK